MQSNAGYWKLTPVILATWEAEISMITVQNQLRQIICKALSRKYPTQPSTSGSMPVILATLKAEIRKIVVQSQPRQIVRETLSQKKTITKKG
jgi:hypothetical protein